MEDDDEEGRFCYLWRRRQANLRGVIAMMGLPYTNKTSTVEFIGTWARCPVLCIDHFFGFPCPNGDEEEEETQHRAAFNNLCKAAYFHMSMKYGFPGADSTVVIKSRLNSTFELQRLLQLVQGVNTRFNQDHPLVIIECRVMNEYQWKHRFEFIVKYGHDDVEGMMRSGRYRRPQSWVEMEKARDDYNHPNSQLAPPNWDLHLQQLISKCSNPITVRRLVIDPYYVDSNDHPRQNGGLFDAIKYLLTAPQQQFMHISRKPYTVELRELRPYLFEKRLSNTLDRKGWRDQLCPDGDCAFNYREELTHDDDHHHDDVCGVCGEQVGSRTPAYTCRLCILTLHKSCAERIDFKASRSFDHIGQLSEKHACTSCVAKGKRFSQFCGSCAFQTHLKCGVLPTIINHNSHQHFLSLLLNDNTNYSCEACGGGHIGYSYCCMKCALYYHLKCALLPLELLKHKHGGHEHAMKLMFSHHQDDGMEREESYWCDVCYEDMDPQNWIYSCHHCPYYAAHLKCAGGYNYLYNLKDVKFVQQLQSQFEKADA